MIKDPVCQMTVGESPFHLDISDKRYYFCSQGCLNKFKEAEESFVQKYIYDLIIIGGGPAGLTASVYASTLKIDTLLLAKDLGGQAIDSTKIKNYMGFDFITGVELKEKFQNQLLHQHYIDHQIAEVVQIERRDARFVVHLQSGDTYTAKSLIIATGMSRNRLNVPGEEEFQRRGVCYSVVQDAPRFTDQSVAVIGGGNSALQAASELSRICSNAYIISLTSFTADPEEVDKVRKLPTIITYEKFQVQEILGDEKVTAIAIKSLEEGRTLELEVSGVFIEIGLFPNSKIVADLVELNERGEIKIQPNCATSVPGIFAAGDVTDAFGKRIIIASGEGAKAALAVHKYLSNLKACRRNGVRESTSGGSKGRLYS